ncbi:MAG: lipoprotein signal peptidase [Bacteroidales bacterium]|nr:lipoprotein signal peptidase [Bacteroidales bacterium]
MKKKLWIAGLLVVLILLIDQASKIWIKLHFCLGEEIAVFSWFRIHFLENEGMAFGFSLGKDGGKLLLSVLRLLAIGALGWYTVRLVRLGHKLTYILPFALILAGAIGNMLDCAFYGLLFSDSWFSTAEFLPEGGGYAPFLYGRVVDMLYFPLIETTYPQWVPFAGGQELVFFRPVFNVADSAITVGFIWFLIMQLLGAKTKASAPAHDLD